MMFGFITKREHDQIVAKRDAAYDRLKEQYQQSVSDQLQIALLAANRMREIKRLTARLAPFVAKRDRDPVTKRFLSTRPVGEMVGGGL